MTNVVELREYRIRKLKKDMEESNKKVNADYYRLAPVNPSQETVKRMCGAEDRPPPLSKESEERYERVRNSIRRLNGLMEELKRGS